MEPEAEQAADVALEAPVAAADVDLVVLAAVDLVVLADGRVVPADAQVAAVAATKALICTRM